MFKTQNHIDNTNNTALSTSFTTTINNLESKILLILLKLNINDPFTYYNTMLIITISLTELYHLILLKLSEIKNSD